MTHNEVAAAWIAGNAAHDSVLETDGQSIWIRSLKPQMLGTKLEDGTPVVANWKGRSRSIARAAVRRAAGMKAIWLSVWPSQRLTPDELRAQAKEQLEFRKKYLS